MKTFRVGLHRLYNVTIHAENETLAKELTEYFLGCAKDASTEKEKSENHFIFEEIEMVTNEAFEAEEIIV